MKLKLLILSLVISLNISARKEEIRWGSHTKEEEQKLADAIKNGQIDPNKPANSRKPLKYVKTSALAEALLQKGADAHATYGAGRTFLHAATDYQVEPGVMKILLEAGINPNKTDDYNFSPLQHLAAQCFAYEGKQEELLQKAEALVVQGADTNQKNYRPVDVAGQRAVAIDSTPCRLLARFLAKSMSTK